MLGDELLVAPMYQSGNSRPVYLPMGIWTRLSNNQVFSGEGEPLPIEAANGELPSVLPQRNDFARGIHPTSLHYFPRLGRGVLSL